MHWINAIAMVVMIGSGWKIYDNQPIFGEIAFPLAVSLGGDPATSFARHGDPGFGGALLWHFAAMWVLAINGLAYVAYGVATGRLRRMLLPIRPREFIATARDALRLHLEHDDLTMYNAVQKSLYVGIIALVTIQILAGLAIWKPVQFAWLTALFGGYDTAREVHFLGMVGICAFLAIHVALALLVPRTLVNMVTGGPIVGAGPAGGRG